MEELLEQCANRGYVVRGIYGNYLMVGVRKSRRGQEERG